MKHSSGQHHVDRKGLGTQMPEKRLDGIVSQQVGVETLLYDETTHKAYCLNATAAAVWSACDGSHTVEEIAANVTRAIAHPVNEDLVLFSLNELRRDGLLKPETTPITLDSPSRRVLLQRIGASAVFLLPAIALISAPEAKAAGSINGCVDGVC
jgi:hypothetical protein